MNRLRCFLILFLISVVLIPVAAGDPGEYLADSQNTGVFDESSQGEVSVSWIHEPTENVSSAEAGRERFTGSPLVVNDTVYLGTMGSITLPDSEYRGIKENSDEEFKFSALNLSTGDLDWEMNVEGGIYSSPVYNNGKIYLSSLAGKIYVLEEGTGDIVWEFEAESPIFVSPNVYDGSVYFATRDFNAHELSEENEFFLYSLNASDGTVLWQKEMDQGSTARPAVENDRVYTGDHNGTIYSINASTGETDWRVVSRNHERSGDPLRKYGGISTPALSNESVYVGSYNGEVYSVNRSTGEVDWIFGTGDPVWSSPAVKDGTVYAGSYDENLYAVDSETGREEWRFSADNRISKSSPVVNGRHVYVGSVDGNMYAVNSTEGEEFWSVQTRDLIWSSPVVQEEKILFTSFDGLYAVESGTVVEDGGIVGWDDNDELLFESEMKNIREERDLVFEDNRLLPEPEEENDEIEDEAEQEELLEPSSGDDGDYNQNVSLEGDRENVGLNIGNIPDAVVLLIVAPIIILSMLAIIRVAERND